MNKPLFIFGFSGDAPFWSSAGFEKVMEYTYPRLFTIAPRDVLVSTMKNAFENDEFTIELDSVKVHTIFPVFVIHDTSYAEVKHTMLMKMKYKKTDDAFRCKKMSHMFILIRNWQYTTSKLSIALCRLSIF